MGSRAVRGLDVVVTELELQSLQRSMPADIVSAAAKATRKAFAGEACAPALEIRVKAYFSAVMRRRVATSRSNVAAVARLVAGSVIEDLVSSGRSEAEAIQELERGWAGKLPNAVIDEYRVRMCA